MQLLLVEVLVKLAKDTKQSLLVVTLVNVANNINQSLLVPKQVVPTNVMMLLQSDLLLLNAIKVGNQLL